MTTAQPIVVDAPQRSDEWFKARLGKVTGSRVADVFYNISDAARNAAIRELLEVSAITAKVKETADYQLLNDMDSITLLEKAGFELPESEKRKKYREGTVAERITGLPADPEPYITYDMKWGMVNEDIAITVYQMQERMVVEKAPLLLHPELKCGASPDGFAVDTKTGEKGNVEVKCLRSANHLYHIIKTEEVPEEYMPQIQMQMWINGALWCDFIGFDSRLPTGLKIFVKRVARDDDYITGELEPAVRRFLAECDSDERFFRKKIREDNASS